VKNILVYPCDTEEAREINQALGKLIHCTLFGVSGNNANLRTGAFVYRKYLGKLDEGLPDWSKRLQEIVRKHKIEMIYPASVEAAELLMKHRDQLGVEILSAPLQTIDVCRSEIETSKLLQQTQGTPLGISDGEYQVCCLTDRHGQLRFSSVLGREECDSHMNSIEKVSIEINARLVLRGAWSYQMQISGGLVTGLKIILGIVPEMAICRNNGANLAALTFFDRIGHEIEVRPSSIKVDAEAYLTYHYKIDYDYDDVYMDLDDTVIVNERINPVIIAFLFQCRNEGKRVHLITKHRYELNKTLENYKIDGLFDSIFWIKHSDEKYRYMKRERAIFIDDAYSERKKVAENLGIPAFEVSAVECLIDWRL
jgi:hypothetical protein